MSLFNSFDRSKHFSELGDPLLTQGAGVMTPANRRQAALRNLTNSATFTIAQFAALDNVTPGTAAASKALVLDSSKGIATITSLTATTVNATTVAATTHTGNLRVTRSPVVAAAGSIQGDAAALAEGFQTVSGANGTLGVLLPVPVAGMMVYIKGVTAGVLKVWPSSGAAINGLGSNNSMSLASGLIPAIFIADSTTQWYTFPLLPS